MNKIEIPQAKITREFPSVIDEMTEGQYVYFIGLILQYLAGDITVLDLRVLLIRKLLNIRINYKYLSLPEDEKQNVNSEIYRLSTLVDSFFKEEERDGKKVKIFDLSSTRNFIPRICGKYYGPENAMKKCTFAEFRTAYTYFSAYAREGADDDLNTLCAILYRPRKSFLWLRRLFSSFDGHERIRFTAKSNPYLLRRRINRIKKLPMAIRYGIFLYFSGCEEYFRKGQPVVDGKEINFSVLYEKSAEGEDSSIGMVGLLYTLAESKVFGSIEETDNQNIWDIMIRLYQVVMQAKQIETKYGSAANI